MIQAVWQPRKALATLTVLGMLLAGASAASAATVLESESNNSAATADAVNIGDTVLGQLNGPGGGADNDYFAFTAPTAGTVTVTFSSDGGTSEAVNQYISVIDATTATTLATGSISPTSPSRTITFSKTAGHTYHVVLVKPTGSPALYGYHLAIS
ncbi:hypothetical protein [Cohnella rhizosphaerae]|uniref:Peptidase C-terminal archaeal/bacterial domain-containing protein n=1 Tax=Cohnella rhizosphaerae TaxID=1457232 RepID=A0A9X4QVD6_9BACL|nr:hypothetical protein [Cohnella rhizosphaerae]MDG0811377.1 hypothetical protein [Cohnella rhizosphaerae]